MALETASYIANLVITNPDGADQRNTADDHLRLIKATLKRTLPLLDGAVSLSAAQFMRLNDLSRSVQFQLNQLRDGSATAANAIFANSASFAVRAGSASNAVMLGDITADRYARLDSNQTFSVDLIIQQSSPQIFLIDSNGSASCSNVVIGYDGRLMTMRFYDPDFSANNTFFIAQRDVNGSVFCERMVFQATVISMSASVAIQRGLTVAGVNVNDAALFTTGELDNAVVSFDNVQQHAASLSVFRAQTAFSASSAATLAGAAGAASANASTVVVRNSAADVSARFFNTNAAGETGSIGSIIFVRDDDGFMRNASISHVGSYMEARNVSGRTGIRKNLVSGSGPPTISAGSQNGEIWYYY